jgi:hypothetical protein
MQNTSVIDMNKGVYYRLIALWVLCEAMLGGVIHGFKIPVSGLIAGSCAVACICLIAFYVPGKGTIIKATIIVAIFKMMLSPQAPPTAYIAVFFQGFLGQLLFFDKTLYRVSCLVLSVLALLESGLQKIIILTIVYGTNFWKAVDEFISKLAGQKAISSYSLYIGTGYVLLHLVVGIWLGRWAGNLPRKIQYWRKIYPGKIIPAVASEAFLQPAANKKKKFLKLGVLIVWAILVILYLQSSLQIGTPLLPSHVVMQIFIRSLIIILGWYLIISPVLRRILYTWLQRKQSQSKEDVRQILLLLPQMKQLAVNSWRLAGTFRGWRKIKEFCKIILVNTVHA